MTIRTQQITDMRQDASDRFIEKLMAHFSPLWPREVKTLGAGYRTWIEDGVASAATYGIDTQQLSARFVNLWFVWGRDFEKQGGFEWAAEILNDSHRTQSVKVHQLCYRTRIELESFEAERLDRRLVA